VATERSWRFRPWTAAGRSGRASLWVEEALAVETDAWDSAPRLEGARQADVCIVGGGFTGLWTAIRLRELDPSLSVVVVEAELCGTGASGRNGGMVSDWWVKLPTLVKRFGREDAVHIAETFAAGADEIERFCAAEEIDARMSRRGWHWTATSEAQQPVIENVLNSARAAGVSPLVEVAPAELEQRLHSPLHRYGVFDPRGGALQPALLARGLRRVARARGVDVLERSPVTKISADDSGICVRCSNGEVRANRAVLAANAWMAHLPGLREDVVVVSSDIVATAPAADHLRELGWRGGEGAFDAHMLIDYWRTTEEGRVVFGRGGGTLAFAARISDAFERSDRQRAAVERDLRHVLPALRDVKTTHAWAGAVERSSDGLIRFGHLGDDPRLLYAIGYSGSGVVPSVTVGRCLASRLLERDDEWDRLSRLFEGQGRSFPVEPLRFFGGKVVQLGVARKEKAEDAGRSPSWAARRLAQFAPGGVVSKPPRAG
jgi:glycine/D-amino acid oxidase-like deaminating enzyme